MSKKTSTHKIKKKFLEAGNKMPTCVNEGCDNEVAVREWKYLSFRSECSTCMGARKRGKQLAGIKIHKKDFCENIDGHLGFKCPVSKDEWKFYQHALDLDHIDGNHFNNDPSNVRTYCKLCHMRKGAMGGDYNSKKGSGRNLGEILEGKKNLIKHRYKKNSSNQRKIDFD